MSPDDPRHGTCAGYQAGCKCERCARASTIYAKRRRLHRLQTGEGLSVETYRATRRLEALQALGWSLPVIGRHMGIHFQQLYAVNTRAFLTRKHFEAIDRVYQELSMKLPPEATTSERIGVAKVRKKAQRLGWVPPLGWDDIDRDEAPAPIGSKRTTWSTEDLIAEYEHLLSFGVSKDAARRQLKVGKDRIDQAYKARREAA